MNALFTTLRVLHYASAMLLLGEVLFVLLVAWPVFGRARGDGVGEDLERRFGWWFATVLS
jgi:hypothetical protein